MKLTKNNFFLFKLFSSSNGKYPLEYIAYLPSSLFPFFLVLSLNAFSKSKNLTSKSCIKLSKINN